MTEVDEILINDLSKVIKDIQERKITIHCYELKNTNTTQHQTGFFSSKEFSIEIEGVFFDE